jgi:plastocyanin
MGHVLAASGCAVLAALVLVVVPGALPAAATAPASWEVRVGGASDDQALQAHAYFPTVLTIVAGDSVAWALGTRAPHTVTFLSGQARPPTTVLAPDGRTVINPLVAYAQGGASYDGTRYANSGLLGPRASHYSLTFTAPGVFPYLCLLHRGMEGTVVVLPAGRAPPRAPEAYRAQAAREWEVLRARAETLAASAPLVAEPAPGGATDYFLSAGVGGNQASVYRFLPGELTVRVGDTVTWVQSDPQEIHTVTFGWSNGPPSLTVTEPVPFGPPRLVLDPQATLPQGGPVHRGDVYYNSGSLQPFARYTLTFLQPGVYPYVCLVHAGLGHGGTIVVQP